MKKRSEVLLSGWSWKASWKGWCLSYRLMDAKLAQERGGGR